MCKDPWPHFNENGLIYEVMDSYSSSGAFLHSSWDFNFPIKGKSFTIFGKFGLIYEQAKCSSDFALWSWRQGWNYCVSTSQKKWSTHNATRFESQPRIRFHLNINAGTTIKSNIKFLHKFMTANFSFYRFPSKFLPRARSFPFIVHLRLFKQEH